MTDSKEISLSTGTMKILKFSSLVFGFVMILTGTFANHIGLSAGAGIGRGQIILAVLGILLMLAGVLGRAFMQVYKSFSRFILTLILLICILELVSTALVFIETREKRLHSDFVLKLAPGLDCRYYPFTGWRCFPPDSIKDPDILLLGGSALALPRLDNTSSQFSFLADSVFSCNGYTVSDYSQPFYNSTQSFIQLILLLRNGLHPSNVFLISGPGDILAAIESGTPMIPLGTDLYRAETWSGLEGAVDLGELRRRKIQREAGLPAIITIIHDLTGDDNKYYSPFTEIPDLADEKLDSLAVTISQMIIAHCETMDALAASFSFDGHIIWLEANPEQEFADDPYYNLHVRTSFLISELADSIECLSTIRYDACVPPANTGSGYSGLDKHQCIPLINSINELILTASNR